MSKIFTSKDIGCYADGANGQDHRRAILWELLDNLGDKRKLPLMAELKQKPSDGYGEEVDSIELLQDYTEEGLVWVQDGDLLLMSESELGA